MPKYRKKSEVIEAIQYGPHEAPSFELLHFVGDSDDGEVSVTKNGLILRLVPVAGQEPIDRLVRVGDYITKDSAGKIVVVDRDTFEAAFEPIQAKERGI